ncbi:MAG: hypothetical protein U0792_11465 [Gemmataceae bacterium]
MLATRSRLKAADCWYPFVAVLFLVTFIDAAVHPEFLLLDGVVSERRWVFPQTLGAAGHEDWPDRRDPDHVMLGYVLKEPGLAATMIFGVLGHAARFAVFAFYPKPWAAVTVNILRHLLRLLLRTVYIFVDGPFRKTREAAARACSARGDHWRGPVHGEPDLRSVGGDVQDGRRATSARRSSSIR